MANVRKLVELIFGSNPSDDDLRAIVEILNERLPKPIIETPIEPSSKPEPTAFKSKTKNKEG